MLRRSYQFHLTRLIRAGEHAKTTADAFVWVSIGKLFIISWVISLGNGTHRASRIDTGFAPAALFQVFFSDETALNNGILVQFLPRQGVSNEGSTAAIMAIA